MMRRTIAGHAPRLIAITVLCGQAILAAGIGTNRVAAAEAQLAPSSALAGTPACVGAHDLRIQGGFLTLKGDHSYDRVCVTNGGELIADGPLTLHAGLLFVDTASSISSNPPRVLSTAGCGQRGEPAFPLTLLVRTAIIEGQIAANGGDGEGYGCPVGGNQAGGAGGTLLLQALTLTISAAISATGGAGGDGSGGDGGAGGRVNIAVAPPAQPNLASYLHVDGGPGDQNAPAGSTPQAGAAGQVYSTSLSDAQRQALPPAPAPLLQALGTQPTRTQPQAVAEFSRGMSCGPADLDIGAGQRRVLQGTIVYPHVCVHDGGLLQAAPRLTLIADTISVDARSQISADGAITSTTTLKATGQYTVGAWPRTAPPPGVPGAKGDDCGDDPSSDNFVEGPLGGAGGGSLTLIAGRMLIAGTVSANGATGGTGGAGYVVGRHTFNSLGTGNAGGGSGGGLLIVAQTVQLTGMLSVLGGNAGTFRDVATYDGAHSQPSGGPGQVTLLADTLAAPSGDLPIAGPGYLGHTLPVDPVPPAATGRYFAAVGHMLSGPFLASWQQLGGLDALGLPRTEPFSEHGTVLQYTDRALLLLVHGQVQLAPLGRQLTQGHIYPTVAPFSSTATRRYYPSTQHTLSGRYLAFWQSHNGAVLLGAPISEVVQEENGDGSRRQYAVQWFERGRLEYHPEHAGTRYAMELGLLGVTALQQRGWLPKH